MPFYRFATEEGEELELFLNMSELTDEIERDGKIYRRIPEFATTFHLKGNGWASKGSATMSNPKKSKADIGLKIDQDKKKEMES